MKGSWNGFIQICVGTECDKNLLKNRSYHTQGVALSVLRFCLPGPCAAKAGLCTDVPDQLVGFCELLCQHHALVLPFQRYKPVVNRDWDSDGEGGVQKSCGVLSNPDCFTNS